MRWPGFVGGSYTPRSVNVDAERCINLYPEVVDGGTPAVRSWLIGTPGIKGFVNFTQELGGPVRALFSMNNRAFAVIGQGFYEFFNDGHGKRWWSMATDGSPATICSNGTAGNQIFIVSGGRGYIFHTDTNYAETITDANFPYPCSMGAFIDGYFIGLLAQSREFRISALEDGMVWEGVDVAQVSTAGDNLRALAVHHRELWLFGEQNSHIWYNDGTDTFPFRPLQGTSIEHGILAPYSVVQLDNRLYWLGADKLGVGQVWRSDGYTPVRVSTHAVEYWLSKRGRLTSAIAYAYQDEGHSFYVLYVPDAETTFVYDVATGFWHERASWNTDNSQWEPHIGRCHCYAFGRHFIGARDSGQIFEMSLDLYDEDLNLVTSNIEVYSASPSASASQSASASPSLSTSTSASVSPSRSASQSSSQSSSLSTSTSSSLSSSLSTSASSSLSASASASESPSQSPSQSPSESPSMSASMSTSASP